MYGSVISNLLAIGGLMECFYSVHTTACTHHAGMPAMYRAGSSQACQVQVIVAAFGTVNAANLSFTCVVALHPPSALYDFPQSRAFKFWLWYASKQKRQQLALKRSSAKKQQKLLQGAFACWVEYVGHRHLKTQLGEKQGLQVCALFNLNPES